METVGVNERRITVGGRSYWQYLHLNKT